MYVCLLNPEQFESTIKQLQKQRGERTGDPFNMSVIFPFAPFLPLICMHAYVYVFDYVRLRLYRKAATEFDKCASAPLQVHQFE